MKVSRFVLLALVMGLALTAWGADTVSVQGKLQSTDGVPLANGTYGMRFTLCDSATTGTFQWSETHIGASAVSVSGGLYSAVLGAATAFPADLFSANADLWLEVEVDTDNSGTFEAGEAFSPRLERQ